MAKMGFMKSAAEVLTGNGKPSLRAYLHTRMTGLRSPRSIMRIHASELTKPDTYCPRETSLHLITGRDRPDDYINTCLQYTFDLGDALHDLLRDTWARDIVFGDWRCKHCDKRYYQTRYPKSCTGCGRSRFMYEEVRFKSLVSGASGGLDLLVKLPGVDKLVIVEAKTIKHDDWKVLKAPQAEHELRTNYYMRLVDESDNNLGEFIDTEQALVIYMTKGYGGK
ncbi:MAG: hypothetical protein OEX12_14220, partial [Gammaproteobacteria bacterium]|nr:hypothetical protein [Gammaproteobacteria bacterium]